MRPHPFGTLAFRIRHHRLGLDTKKFQETKRSRVVKKHLMFFFSGIFFVVMSAIPVYASVTTGQWTFAAGDLSNGYWAELFETPGQPGWGVDDDPRVSRAHARFRHPHRRPPAAARRRRESAHHVAHEIRPREVGRR